MTASIAVIIPARNAATFLGEALDSALSQVPAPAETVVIDDRSEDATALIAHSFGSRVRVIEGPGLGPSTARNLGILHTTSELVAFLDADDVWLSGKLASQIAAMRSEAAGLAYTDFYIADSPSHPGAPKLQEYAFADHPDSFRALIHENFILTSSVMLLRKVLARAGLFRHELRGGEDRELWMRIARVAPFARVDQPLVFKRRHETNITRERDYADYSVATWSVIAREHTDVSPELVSMIQKALLERQLDAGWHAMRSGDYDKARAIFRKVPWTGASRWPLARSRAIAALPDIALKRLHALKKRLARGVSD